MDHTEDSLERFAERYRIDRLLGQGGMGKVYLAYDTLLENEPVALKILHRELCEDESQMRRFLREVQVTRRITHPNVVRTFDVGLNDGALFMTMELIQGSSLREYALGQALPVPELVRILLEITRGLEAIHSAGIIHRDLKPANVLIAKDGAVRVTDFGVAREQRSTLTSPNELIGSAAYMAPELWRGEQASVLTDLYALGILAYEISTGQVPYEGKSPAEIMARHLAGAYRSPQQIRADLPDWLSKLICLLIAPEPSRRPRSASHACQVLTSGIAQLKKAAESRNGESTSSGDRPPSVRRGATTTPAPSAPPNMNPAVPVRSRAQPIAPRATYSVCSEISPDSQRACARRGLFEGARPSDDDSSVEPAPHADSSSNRRGALRSILAFAVPTIFASAVMYGLMNDFHSAAVGWWYSSSSSTGSFGIICRLLAPPLILSVTWLVLTLPLALAAFTKDGYPLRFLARATLIPITLLGALVLIDCARLGNRGGYASSTYNTIRMKSILRQNTEKVVRSMLLTPIGKDTIFGAVQRAEVQGVAERLGVAVTSKTGPALDLRLQEERRRLDLSETDRINPLDATPSLAGVPFAYLLICGVFTIAFMQSIAHDWFGSTSSVGARVMPLLFWSISIAFTLELLGRSFLMSILPTQADATFQLPFWFFAIPLDGYSIGCAVINWSIVLVQLLVVGPRLDANA